MYRFASLLLFCLFTSISIAQVNIEKLDSVIATSSISNNISSRSLHFYDVQARDTFVQLFYNPNGSSNATELLNSTSTTYNGNQITIEVFLASINGLSRRDVITLDANGDELERVIETYSFISSTFDFSSKEVVTNRTAQLLEIEIYAWSGSDFILNQKREIEYLNAGGTINTIYQISGSNLIPLQRQTIEFDETTGVQTLFLNENFDQAQQDWNTTLQSITTLNTGNMTGLRIWSSLTGAVTDSILISYNADWLPMEELTYQFNGNNDPYLSRKNEYEYTANKNILQDRISSDQNGTLLPSSVLDYYYTMVMVSSITAIDDSPFPIELIYQNPSSGDGTVYIEGEPNSFLFRMINRNGQIVHQNKVNAGESINLNIMGLQSGIYFMSLQTRNKQKSWKLVIE